MEQIEITPDYRNRIGKDPTVMAVRFVAGQPVEVIRKDMRWAVEDQVLLTRKEILEENDK